MSDYLECVQFKKQGDKWRATRLGSAKKNDKGQLIVYLDSLPIPDAEGNVRLTIQAKQERDERPQQSAPAQRQDLDDEIPF
jgi:hypothetical protein